MLASGPVSSRRLVLEDDHAAPVFAAPSVTLADHDRPPLGARAGVTVALWSALGGAGRPGRERLRLRSGRGIRVTVSTVEAERLAGDIAAAMTPRRSTRLA